MGGLAPDVSVVIPTRNRWPLLADALSSALGQHDVTVEVIVVDDASSDETAERLAGIEDSRLTILRNHTPAGQAAARNQGLRAARAEWLAFLDDDDLWHPCKLRSQLDALKGSGTSWAYGAAVVVDAGRRPIRLATPPPDPTGVFAALLSRNVLPAGASNVIARTDLLRSVGGFDERLSQLTDWDLWIRLAARGRPSASREILVAYTHHEENIVLNDPDEALSELEYMGEKHGAAGVEVDRTAVFRWIAWAHRRNGNRRRAAATYLRGAVVNRDPGNLLRALGSLLGEAAMRGPRSGGAMPATELEWLLPYTREL